MRLAPQARLAFILTLPLWAPLAFAETVRVASWSLPPGGGATSGRSGEMLAQTGAALRELNPDVILLQGVKDWQTCSEIAQALQPAVYHVSVCSSFNDPATGKRAPRQVSILSKQKAYSFWSASWVAADAEKIPQGGFAFIALPTPRQRLGFYCVDVGTHRAGEQRVQQLLEHVRLVKRWEANPVQAAFVGGIFAPSAGHSMPETVSLLQETGFADACFDLRPERRASATSAPEQSGGPTVWLLAERALFGLGPQEIFVAGQLLTVCDLELDPARVAAGWPARAQELERRSAARTAPERDPQTTLAVSGQAPGNRGVARTLWWVGIPAVLILIGAGVWLRRSRRPLALPPHSPSALLEANWNAASSYTVVVSPQLVTGSAEKESPGSAATHQVVHLEAPALQTHSAGAPWLPRPSPADEVARSRLLTDLARWLKQKLVRSLVADRQRLLEAQQAAALKAKAVDERLSKIEQQILRQTRDYEVRIDELTRELLAAKEENRELIRARIVQVKLEMEAVRARMLANARTEGDPGRQL